MKVMRSYGQYGYILMYKAAETPEPVALNMVNVRGSLYIRKGNLPKDIEFAPTEPATELEEAVIEIVQNSVERCEEIRCNYIDCQPIYQGDTVPELEGRSIELDDTLTYFSDDLSMTTYKENEMK